MKSIMIAGTSSGVGKTTICLGIMAALSRRNKNVAPYKTGPDYIDTAFHKFVTGNASCNLDNWMLDDDTIRYLFGENSRGRDVAVIEGVMGLYDGFGIEDLGSSAYLSKVLKAPVVLVIDGRGMSRSAAATVLGYKEFDRDVNIRGVIINNISSKSHYELLKDAIYKHTGIESIGYLPKNRDISLESRHLGLVQAEETANLDKKIDELSGMIEKYIDLDALLGIAEEINTGSENKEEEYLRHYGIAKGLKIGVARDKAFSFYYEDNLRLLGKLGVELEFFSPISCTRLPDIDGLYMGGGYPEVFAGELEENVGFRQELRKRLEEGMPAYAECGGFMYLTESIQDLSGNVYETVGFLPAKAKMTKRLQRFGYVDVEMDGGLAFKAHEFHKSLIEAGTEAEYCYKVHKVRKNRTASQWKCGMVKENVLAAYPHVHFYSNIAFVLEFIDKVKNCSGKF